MWHAVPYGSCFCGAVKIPSRETEIDRANVGRLAFANVTQPVGRIPEYDTEARHRAATGHARSCTA